MARYRVFHLLDPPVVAGVVDVVGGRLVFFPSEHCPEPYSSRFQEEILDPLQGRKLSYGVRAVGPDDVAADESAFNAYGKALEAELQKKKIDGKPIKGFSDI